jgi:serine/threonine protein kinase
MASPVFDPTRGSAGAADGGTGSGSSRRKTHARVEAAMLMSLRDGPALHHHYNPDYNSSVASLGHLPAAGHTTSATIGASHDAAGLMVDDGGAFTVNQYLLLCELGAGKQGRVFLAEDTSCGMARAVKVIPRPGGQRQRAIEQAQMQSNGSGPPSMTASPSNAGSALAVARAMRHRGLQREVSVMKKCRHKNIVALYEVIDDPNDDRMYLVMQYVEQGPLASLSPDGSVSRTFNAADLAGIARQLCAGLEYLHRKGVAHRDIKPDNILRDRDGTVYLSDFGMAELLESDSVNPSSARQGIHGTRGTIAFMAPELFDASSTELVAGEPVDVWALGISFYALLFGRVPWTRPPGAESDDASGATATASSQQRTRSITDQICAFNVADSIPAQLSADGNGNFAVDRFSTVVPASDLPPELFPSWRDLLVAMLTLDPAARITANELRKRVLALDALAASLNNLTPDGSTTDPANEDPVAQMAESVTRRW